MLKRQLADSDTRDDPNRLRLVFLASCESAARDTSNAFRGLAPCAGGSAGVPAVVAMQDRVAIGAARAFSGTFYAACSNMAVWIWRATRPAPRC